MVQQSMHTVVSPSAVSTPGLSSEAVRYQSPLSPKTGTVREPYALPHIRGPTEVALRQPSVSVLAQCGLTHLSSPITVTGYGITKKQTRPISYQY
jgi:hypothetical protein